MSHNALAYGFAIGGGLLGGLAATPNWGDLAIVLGALICAYFSGYSRKSAETEENGTRH